MGLSLLKDIDRRGLESKDIKKWDHYNFEIDQVKKEALQRILKEGNEVSAELKSISKIISTLHPQERINIRFISSYTILSALASEVLKDYINEKFPKNIEAYFNRGKDAIYGLQVRDADLFMNEGMPNLLARLSEILEEIGMTDSCGEPKVLFNMTGGFKATIPYLTFFAQLHDIPTYYIFERSDQLIEIPYFPLEFDFGVIDDNFHAFREHFPKNGNGEYKPHKIPLSKFKDKCGSEKSFNELLKKKIIKIEGDYVIPTLMGLMLYKRYQQEEPYTYDLYGKYVELKVYKYLNCTKSHLEKRNNVKILSIEHSKRFPSKFNPEGWEADLFIEYKTTKGAKKGYIAIEIKPLRNLTKGTIQRKNDLFLKHVKPNYPNSEFQMYFYGPILLPEERRRILNYKQEFPSIRFFHIPVPPSTEHRFDWEILENPPYEIK